MVDSTECQGQKTFCSYQGSSGLGRYDVRLRYSFLSIHRTQPEISCPLEPDRISSYGLFLGSIHVEAWTEISRLGQGASSD